MSLKIAELPLTPEPQENPDNFTMPSLMEIPPTNVIDGVPYEEMEKYVVYNSLKCSNYVAYYFELLKNILNSPSPKLYQKSLMEDCKCSNFVTSYDKCCLVCRKRDASKRCSKCKSVYYCSNECAIRAWPIHKKHCGRDIFNNCVACGNTNVPFSKCPNCPVKYCSQKCYNDLHVGHEEIDCEALAKIFGTFYT